MGYMVVVSQKMTTKSLSIGIEMYVAQTFKFSGVFWSITMANKKLKYEILFWIVYTILVFGFFYRTQVLEFLALGIGIGYTIGIRP